MKPETPLTATQLDLYQSYAAHDPDKLTHSERRLLATIAALRTQLEQAQGDLGDVRAKNRELATRETALREALDGVLARWEGELPAPSIRQPQGYIEAGIRGGIEECAKELRRALSGEQGESS